MAISLNTVYQMVVQNKTQVESALQQMSSDMINGYYTKTQSLNVVRSFINQWCYTKSQTTKILEQYLSYNAADLRYVKLADLGVTGVNQAAVMAQLGALIGSVNAHNARFIGFDTTYVTPAAPGYPSTIKTLAEVIGTPFASGSVTSIYGLLAAQATTIGSFNAAFDTIGNESDTNQTIPGLTPAKLTAFARIASLQTLTTGIRSDLDAIFNNSTVTAASLPDLATEFNTSTGAMAFSGPLVFDALKQSVTDHGILGDTPTSGLRGEVATLKTTVGDTTVGLVKKVADLDATINTATTGLVAKVTALETSVGVPAVTPNSATGLFLKVENIENNYQKKVDLDSDVNTLVDVMLAPATTTPLFAGGKITQAIKDATGDETTAGTPVARIKALEDTIDTATTGLVDIVTATTTGLVDRVDALENTAGTLDITHPNYIANPALTATQRLEAAELTIGDSSAGLVKDVSDAVTEVAIVKKTAGLTPLMIGDVNTVDLGLNLGIAETIDLSGTVASGDNQSTCTLTLSPITDADIIAAFPDGVMIEKQVYFTSSSTDINYVDANLSIENFKLDKASEATGVAATYIDSGLLPGVLRLGVNAGDIISVTIKAGYSVNSGQLEADPALPRVITVAKA